MSKIETFECLDLMSNRSPFPGLDLVARRYHAISLNAHHTCGARVRQANEMGHVWVA